MKTYADKLRDPRWQKKRLEILEKHDWTCDGCGHTTKSLNVHHRWYKAKQDPWNYEDHWYSVLCCDCHDYEHQSENSIQLIIDFLFRIGITNNELVAFRECLKQISENQNIDAKEEMVNLWMKISGLDKWPF